MYIPRNQQWPSRLASADAQANGSHVRLAEVVEHGAPDLPAQLSLTLEIQGR
jgi:hypothetical protein